MPNSIQLRDRESFKEQWQGRHFIHTDSNGNPNLLELNRNDSGEWLNAWNDNPDKQWNRENVFVFLAPKVSLFLSRSANRRFGRVLFLKLTIPAAKHFTNRIYFNR